MLYIWISRRFVCLAMTADISTLYADCQHDLLGFLTRKLHCPYTAEDIAQESFAILVRATKESVIDHPRHFLFKTAANLAVDYVRHNKVVERHVAQYKEEALTLSPEQGVSDAEWLRLLRETLSELPSRTRDVFILNRLQGLSYLDVGLRLGISESAVEKHISRGIQHCRKQLGKHFLPPSKSIVRE